MRIFILFLFTIISFHATAQILQNSSSISGTSDTVSIQIINDSTSARKDTVSIIGVGDIMMGTNYPEDKLPADDGAFLMKEVESILNDADMTFGNLEGTLLDSGGTAKKCQNPKVCYAFRTPVRYVSNLINAGFDMMSLANNHAGDMGDEGRNSTMMTLEEAGIL